MQSMEDSTVLDCDTVSLDVWFLIIKEEQLHHEDYQDELLGYILARSEWSGTV